MPNQPKQLPQDDELTVETSISVSTRSISPPLKRKVWFSPAANRVVPITHINDMTTTVINELWFTEDELLATKKEVLTVLKSIAKEGVDYEENDQQTYRGLEYRTSQGAEHRQANRYQALNAVLYEQWRQRETGQEDAEYLADVYFNATYQCLEDAYLIAMYDEAFAKGETGEDIQKRENKPEVATKVEDNKQISQDKRCKQSKTRKLKPSRSHPRRSKIVGFFKNILVTHAA